MKQVIGEITTRTSGKGLYEITDQVAAFVTIQDMASGLLTVFVQHTSASLVIQENADPSVRHDLDQFFSRLVPEGASYYRHTTEGADDMPAHIRSALTQVQLSIPVAMGRMALGTWQGIYLFEHRARPHTRQLALHLIGE